jgi:putative membrane protein
MPQAPPAMPQMATVPGTISYQPTSRALPALGIDFVRIKIPIIRLFAVPTTPEVTVSMPAAPVYAPPVVAQPVYAQPVAQPVVPVAPPVAQPVVPVAPPAVPALPVCPPCPPCPVPQASNPQAPEIERLTKQVQSLEAALGQYANQLKAADKSESKKP